MKHLRVKPSGLQSLQSRSKAEVRSEQCDICKNLDGFQLGYFDMICASSKSFTSTDRSHSPRPSECKTCLKSLPPLLLCILCFLCALSFSLLSSPCPSVSLCLCIVSLGPCPRLSVSVLCLMCLCLALSLYVAVAVTLYVSVLLSLSARSVCLYVSCHFQMGINKLREHAVLCGATPILFILLSSLLAGGEETRVVEHEHGGRGTSRSTSITGEEGIRKRRGGRIAKGLQREKRDLCVEETSKAERHTLTPSTTKSLSKTCLRTHCRTNFCKDTDKMGGQPGPEHPSAPPSSPPDRAPSIRISGYLELIVAPENGRGNQALGCGVEILCGQILAVSPELPIPRPRGGHLAA